MVRSGAIAEMLSLNMGKGYGQQLWVRETPRHSYSIEAVKVSGTNIL